MPGLDPSIISLLDPQRTLGRVCHDVRSDFILSPHYQIIFEQIGADLWDQLVSALRSGSFQPSLPITVDMPKATGITRPISILSPMDRLLYQALADVLAPAVESSVDRSKVYSIVLLDPDPETRMFAETTECWNRLQAAIEQHCADGQWTYAIKADICSFYERIRQHSLVNLLYATGCIPGAVRLLEELLLAWMERNSHGILQGMMPSDLLGNFSLVGLDAEIEVQGHPHLRHVDDLYVFFPSRREAQRGLIELCKCLRSEGLNLNPLKSAIRPVGDLLREETQLDELFKAARDEVAEELTGEYSSFYGFELYWTETEVEIDEEEIHLLAVGALWEQLGNPDAPTDQIHKFCLPALGAAGLDLAVDDAIAGIHERPHLAKHYARYLWQVGRQDSVIRDELERIVKENDFTSDWQTMWPIAALYFMDSAKQETVKEGMRLLKDYSHTDCLRALCAMLVGKHGTAAQRQALRHQYTSEPSEYVRSGILFSAQYFPAAERRTCLKAWGAHSRTNALVASAMRKAQEQTASAN